MKVYAPNGKPIEEELRREVEEFLKELDEKESK